MIIAVDFDGTIVVQDGYKYSDLETPLKFMPGAKEGLAALKRAGHTLILWSGRASHYLRVNPELSPLVRASGKAVNLERWAKDSQPLNQARYEQMLEFVAVELPGVFDAIDEGDSGKPPADLFIDDKAVRYGLGLSGMGWTQLGKIFGAAA